jgi:PadR family transcriptional regulator AphA
MSLPHVLLGMIHKRPGSGYDINKSLKKIVRYFWDADQSRIYRTLNELCDKGWVTYESIIQEGSPNKKIYSITDAGELELRRWLGEPGKMMEERPRSPFLVQLHFSDAIPPKQQQYVVEERLKVLRVELAQLEQQAEEIKLAIPMPEDILLTGLLRGDLTLAYGIQRYRFEIAWAEHLLRILGQLIDEETSGRAA